MLIISIRAKRCFISEFFECHRKVLHKTRFVQFYSARTKLFRWNTTSPTLQTTHYLWSPSTESSRQLCHSRWSSTLATPCLRTKCFCWLPTTSTSWSCTTPPPRCAGTPSSPPHSTLPYTREFAVFRLFCLKLKISCTIYKNFVLNELKRLKIIFVKCIRHVW